MFCPRLITKAKRLSPRQVRHLCHSVAMSNLLRVAKGRLELIQCNLDFGVQNGSEAHTQMSRDAAIAIARHLASVEALELPEVTACMRLLEGDVICPPDRSNVMAILNTKIGQADTGGLCPEFNTSKKGQLHPYLEHYLRDSDWTTLLSAPDAGAPAKVQTVGKLLISLGCLKLRENDYASAAALTYLNEPLPDVLAPSLLIYVYIYIYIYKRAHY